MGPHRLKLPYFPTSGKVFDGWARGYEACSSYVALFS